MQKFTGKQYLKIDIANSFGLDKETWDTRLAWFDKHEHELGDILPQAADPAMYYAGIEAWHKATIGEPSGYMISLDATSSGLQILAALTGDREAALLCNVLDFSPQAEIERRDGYTVIYNLMVERLHQMGAPAGNITRDDTKQAIMTSLYGSQAVPKEVFGEGIQLNVFYQVMARVAPAVWELNEAFLDMWNPDALSHDWILPDNFHVHVKVMDQVKETIQFLNEPYDTFHAVNRPTEEGRSLGANTIHSLDGMIVREMGRRCDYNPDTILRVTEALINKMPGGLGMGRPEDIMVTTLWQHYEESGYLSARILDYLSLSNIGIVEKEPIWELINSLPDKPFKVIAVHDCFRCLPNYGNDLRIQYNHQLAEIAKSNMLQFLLSQIVGRKLNIGKLDPDMWKEVSFTNYALS